jgi:hypothetical protein
MISTVHNILWNTVHLCNINRKLMYEPNELDSCSWAGLQSGEKAWLGVSRLLMRSWNGPRPGGGLKIEYYWTLERPSARRRPKNRILLGLGTVLGL